MSRWFRHYAGMMRDEKLVRASIKSKQPVERVVWIWGAILESAAEINDGGRFDIDRDEIAHFLRADVTECNAVVTALETQGHVTCNKVVKWGKRQWSSDDSSDRVRKHREKKKLNKINGDKTVTRNEHETLRNAPETETETETEIDKREAADAGRTDDWPTDAFQQFWAKYPHKVGKPVALKALQKAKRSGVGWGAFIAGLENYIRTKPPDREWCNPSTWLNQGRWEDQPATVDGTNGRRGQGAISEDRSASRAAGRLAEAAKRGEFTFGPRPGLLPRTDSNVVSLLSARRDDES